MLVDLTKKRCMSDSAARQTIFNSCFGWKCQKIIAGSTALKRHLKIGL